MAGTPLTFDKGRWAFDQGRETGPQPFDKGRGSKGGPRGPKQRRLVRPQQKPTDCGSCRHGLGLEPRDQALDPRPLSKGRRPFWGPRRLSQGRRPLSNGPRLVKRHPALVKWPPALVKRPQALVKWPPAFVKVPRLCKWALIFYKRAGGTGREPVPI
jgi:hypothetical protein